MKQKVTYEQVIAAALLHFKKLDNEDINLLLKDLEKTIEIEDKYTHPWKNIGTFLKRKENGTILFKDTYNPNTFLENQNCTLREYFKNICGEFLTNYFKNLNTAKFIMYKKNKLDAYKTMMINSAHILLISGSEKELKQFKKYGFKNIDYFNSLVRAEKYFKKHPNELEKYHLVIEGQNANYPLLFHISHEFNNKLNNSNIFHTSFHHHKVPKNETPFIGYFLQDLTNYRDWHIQEYSLKDLIDKLIEWAFINQILESKKITNNFEPLTDYINPIKLPLPKTQDDLKILYMVPYLEKEKIEGAKSLGLNITFVEDNNPALQKNVDKLGDYDIIIASQSYSHRLIKLCNESTEQCKDTGRELTLFVTFDSKTIHTVDEDEIVDWDGFGDKISIDYNFGGNLNKNLKRRKKEYHVLRQIKPDADHWEKYHQSKKNVVQSVIESAINIYNDALEETNNPTLQNLNLRSLDDYDAEYAKVDDKEKLRQQIALEPIHNFDLLCLTVKNFLYYKNNGLINSKLDGLKIIERKNDIYIENLLDGRPLCAITINKYYQHKNLRTFSIQTMNKKGTLTNPETVGLYTRKFEQMDNVPKRPDEKQMTTLNAIHKKINYLLKALNNKANKKQNELKEREKTLKLAN